MSISELIVELRSLAKFSGFKADTINEMLWDHLVCSIRDKRLQQRLLAKADNVTFGKALKIAQSFEAAERDAKDMQCLEQPESTQVNKTTYKQNQPPLHKPSA